MGWPHSKCLQNWRVGWPHWPTGKMVDGGEQYKALRAVQSLTGCAKPHGQYEALRLNRRLNRPANL
jgi:hypothetical protein